MVRKGVQGPPKDFRSPQIFRSPQLGMKYRSPQIKAPQRIFWRWRSPPKKISILISVKNTSVKNCWNIGTFLHSASIEHGFIRLYKNGTWMKWVIRWMIWLVSRCTQLPQAGFLVAATQVYPSLAKPWVDGRGYRGGGRIAESGIVPWCTTRWCKGMKSWLIVTYFRCLPNTNVCCMYSCTEPCPMLACLRIYRGWYHI